LSDSPVSPKPEAAIQQLNLGYNVEQDRLLLRVGLSDNTELMVWLTLRITKQLWALLNGETHLPTASSIQIETPPQQAVQQFQQEMQAVESLQKLDFSTEYQPRKAVRSEGAMLATALQLTDDGVKHLDITCLEGINVRMNLTQELILAMCNMLQLSAKEAGWEIGAPISISLVVDSGEQKVLH
jgi:alanine racemase